MRAYTRLVRWSVRHHYMTVALGLADLRRLDRQLLSAAVGLPAGRGQRPRCCSRSSCRRLAGSRTRAPSPTQIARSVRERARGRERLRQSAAPCSAGQRRCARPRSSSTWCRKDEARAHARPRSRARSADELADDARHPLLVPATTTASASCSSVVIGPRRRRGRRAGAPSSRARCKRIPHARATSSRRPSSTGPSCASCPITDVAAELGVSTDAHRRRRVRVATIGDIDANLAKFDVGDRQVPIRVQLDGSARAATGSCSKPCKVADRVGRRRCRCRRWPTFELRPGADRDRPLRPHAPRRRSAPTCVGDDALGEARGRGHGAAGGQEPAGRRRASSRPATPRSWARCSQSFAKAMGAGMMMVLRACWCCCSAASCSRSPSCSRCRCRSAAPSSRCSSPASRSAMPVVIGILMLMGIVTKNAIMLVDFAIEEMRRGMPRDEAIVDAGRKRARPIVMTTIAMVGRHAAVGAGARRRRRVPRADGDRGDRRPDRLDAAVAGLRAGRLHRDGRHRAGSAGACSAASSAPPRSRPHRCRPRRRPPPTLGR